MEPVHQVREQEVERAQAEDGEDVGGEDDERVAGDAEDGRDRVHGEDDVGAFDDEQDQEQEGGLAPAVVAHEEARAVVAAGDRQEAPDQPHDEVLLRRDLFVPGEQEADPGDDQERPEQVDQPVEAPEQRGAGEDERRAQHEGAEDAPEQHPVLQLLRHLEVGEDDQEDEQVVDRERVLDQVAGDELEPDLVSRTRGRASRRRSPPGRCRTASTPPPRPAGRRAPAG